MRNIRNAHVLLIVFTLIMFYGCSQDELTIIDDITVTNEIQLNTVFNFIEINDSYLLSGINNSKITIYKLNVNFETIWKRDSFEWGTTFNEGGWGGSFYSVNIINIFSDNAGNYICFCLVEEGSCVISSSVLVIKLDKFGNEIKRTKLENTYIVDVAKTFDNGFLLAGDRLIKLNENFTQEWENNNQSYIFSGAKIIRTNDQGFAITGTWDSKQVQLQKLDKNGIVLWTKTNFNQKPLDDFGFDLIQTGNDGYFIIGRTRDITYPWDMNCFLIRTDFSGDTLWTKKFGERYNEWLEDFLYSSDTAYIVKETIGFPIDSIHKTVLLKINSDGQLIESKETSFEELVFVSAGYFVKAEKINDNIIKLSKIQINDLF